MKQATKMEAVYVPRAHHARDPENPAMGYAPGGRFIAYTSPYIRMRNIERYKNTPYQRKKAEAQSTVAATAEAVREAFASAQAGSLAHRGYGRAA